jgi:hypothetical protein
MPLAAALVDIGVQPRPAQAESGRADFDTSEIVRRSARQPLGKPRREGEFDPGVEGDDDA